MLRVGLGLRLLRSEMAHEEGFFDYCIMPYYIADVCMLVMHVFNHSFAGQCTPELSALCSFVRVETRSFVRSNAKVVCERMPAMLVAMIEGGISGTCEQIEARVVCLLVPHCVLRRMIGFLSRVDIRAKRPQLWTRVLFCIFDRLAC